METFPQQMFEVNEKLFEAFKKSLPVLVQHCSGQDLLHMQRITQDVILRNFIGGIICRSLSKGVTKHKCPRLPTF